MSHPISLIDTVAFLVILEVAAGGRLNCSGAALLFFREVVGGLLLGLTVGRLVRSAPIERIDG